jgi:hypothetical protein
MAATVGVMLPKTLLVMVAVIAVTVGLMLAAGWAPARRAAARRPLPARAGTPRHRDRAHPVGARPQMRRPAPSRCGAVDYRDENTRRWLRGRPGVKRVGDE